jgi:dienelactone hydrolase
VEYTAYIPLMKALASEGILGVLVEMPFHLAVLDIDAAEGIREQYPQVEQWYIGGHSLGGSMAAAYLAEEADDFEGLILLGSYSTTDLSETDLSVVSIYGSEDLVMNREKYEENKANLPDEFSEVILDGGCHAYFGMYGAQEGDGTPEISNEEQIALTVDAISEMVLDVQ